MVKRTKYQDRDKYYRLAKERGFRARSAFKLLQINRKHEFLSNAKVLIDLCAAPGGWLQVAAQTMPSKSVIVGVDLLPIRAIPKVTTLVADITSGECREQLRKELHGWKADVVLCDGAPNVGANYVKDAFVQNELVLAALKTATEHLVGGGTFCTKVYRSRDYNKLLWVLQQLFKDIKPIKPSSSRQASAEIFLLCLDYLNPSAIDPRMLDPAHVFAVVEGEQSGSTGVTIFHKAFDSSHRRRQGYAADSNATLTKVVSAAAFISSGEPVQVLSDATEICFTNSEEDKALLENDMTTVDIREACADLKVLGKGDFKALLKWRLKLRKMLDEQAEKEREETKEDAAVEGEDGVKEQTEEDIQKEIQDLHDSVSRKRKREKKKKHEKLAKARERAALGMDKVAFDLPDHDSMFNIVAAAQGETAGARGKVRQMDPLEALNAFEAVHGGSLHTEEMDGHEESKRRKVILDKEDRLDMMEEALDGAYELELRRKAAKKSEATREEADEALKKSRKRSNAKKIELAGQMAQEEAMLNDGDASEYIRQLGGQSDEDDSDDGEDGGYDNEEDDLEDEDDGLGVLEEDAKVQTLTVGDDDGDLSNRHEAGSALLEGVPLQKLQSASVWFDNPLFKRFQSNLDELDAEVGLTRLVNVKKQQAIEHGNKRERGSVESREHKSEPESVSEEVQTILDRIPKTDKEIRAERRRKLAERKQRRDAKKQKLDELDGTVEVVPSTRSSLSKQSVPASAAVDSLDDPELTPEEKKMILQKRSLIRQGMGQVAVDDDQGGPVEVVAQGKLEVKDERKYDSDHEDYDDEDHARHLALGAMMLRKGRARQVVDASYNRYAFNDEAGLPDWFVDDEAKHHRPQLPVPPALMEQMRQKYMSLAAKPIKKVAEARDRKRRRAQQKLKAAKDKAEKIMNNEDLSERAKLRSVQATMAKAHSKDGKGGKKVVVSRKFQGGKGPKGKNLKRVDKRMKTDIRGMKRAEKHRGKRRK